MHPVRQEVAGAGALAAVFLALPRPDRRAGNLSDDRGENNVALELDPACLQRFPSDHEGCQAALHVRDAETLDLVADDAALELRFGFDVGYHAQVRAGTGIAGIGVAVEAEAQSGAVAFDDADRIGPVGLHVLAHGLDAVPLEPG